MVNNIDINSIKPAAYNPRKITEEQKQELCKSIRKFGLIVPILVNRKDNVIIAGHQRTKAARLVGIETVPVQYVDSINLGDEIKFNQIHNATESGTVNVRFDGKAEHEKFIELDNEDFATIENTATVVKEICGLTLKYGNVLSAVICKGDVILGGDYVKACKVLGIKVNAYICDDSMHDDLLHYLGEDYGEYSYDHIHLAFRRKDGSTIDYSSNGVTVRIEGAERLPIDAKYNNPADRHYRTKSYCTCRNWQFANYFETHMKRGIENG